MFKEKLKKAVSIFQWLLTAVLISVVLLLVFTAFNPVKSFQILRVMSGSMEPKIKVGSVVFIQKVKPETLKEGDIITFISAEDPNISVTHRLAAIEEKEGKTVFKTKGDANNTEDMTEVSSSQIKGRVIFSLPFLGYLSVWIKQPLGFGLLVILPAILIIISEIFNIKKAIEKEVEKKYAKQEKQPKNKSIDSLLIFLLLGIGLFQIKPTSAYFSNVAVIEGNIFSMASDWTPPLSPQLILPSNNSYQNTNGLIMDWSDVTDDINNPVYYVYQSANNPGFSPLAYESGHLSNSNIPAPGTPDGVYWWRVKACDSLNNCSPWSNVWKVTVDSTKPTSTITTPQNSESDNNTSINNTTVVDWDGYIAGTATDTLSGVQRVELSINRTDTNQYWNGSGWVGGTEITVRVLTSGTINWAYSFSNHPTGVIYTITSHAVDNAGNIENSYVLILNNVATPTPSPILTTEPTPTPSPILTTEPTPTPSPTPVQSQSTQETSPTPTPAPELTPTSEPTPVSSTTPTPSPSPKVSPTPISEPTSEPTPTLTPTQSPTDE